MQNGGASNSAANAAPTSPYTGPRRDAAIPADYHADLLSLDLADPYYDLLRNAYLTPIQLSFVCFFATSKPFLFTPKKKGKLLALLLALCYSCSPFPRTSNRAAAWS